MVSAGPASVPGILCLSSLSMAERSGYAIEVLPLKDVGIRQLWDKNK